MAIPKLRLRRMQVCAVSRLARFPLILRLLERLGWVVEREACLDVCTRCEHSFFALVEGRMLFADSPEELVRKVE